MRNPGDEGVVWNSSERVPILEPCPPVYCLEEAQEEDCHVTVPGLEFFRPPFRCRIVVGLIRSV